uniref:Tryptophan synthase alpha chain n=1 Tax=Callithamnion tetricum TaxID=193179 RepID=A0A4D6WN70_9FLOR|nr:Tryptophan synthase alpha subunit [Callithamnion tetricum]
MIINAISTILLEKKNNNTCALIPFITAGYPSINMTIDILYTLDRQGADVIELGLPYTDALADGPIIQEASQYSIKQGINFKQVLKIIKTVSNDINAPIVLFTYYNPVLVKGVELFIRDISLAGAKGLIIPDLPVEETDYIINLCIEWNIEFILFIAPTSSELRISEILSKAPGCIYLVSSTGVTGIRNEINEGIKTFSRLIKKEKEKLLILGFGISNQDQVATIAKWNIDGIVIGSAFINIIKTSPHSKILSNIGRFCNQVRLKL